MEERLGKLEQRMDHFEKDQERLDKKIQVLDGRTEEMGKFAVKVEFIVDGLDKTTKNIEKTLTEYITKQETKESEKQKNELLNKEKEITKWQQVSLTLAKWCVIILVSGAAGKGIWEIIKELPAFK